MATYVTLTAPEGTSARGLRIPRDSARHMVSIAETIVGIDPDAYASYFPTLGLAPTGAVAGFGSMAPSDAWESIRNALSAVDPADEPLALGEWTIGRATLAVGAAVGADRLPQELALAVTLPCEEDEVADALNAVFPGTEWEIGRGNSGRILDVGVSFFENSPDEYDALFAEWARPTDWTGLLAAGSRTGVTEIPASTRAFVAPEASLGAFIAAARGAKHDWRGLLHAVQGGPRNVIRWMRVRCGKLVTEVLLPIDVSATDLNSVRNFLGRPETRWHSVTEVVLAGQRNRSDDTVLARGSVRLSGKRAALTTHEWRSDDAVMTFARVTVR